MAVETKILISAQDKSAAAFSSVNRNLSGLNSTVRRALGAVAGLAGVYGLGAMLKASFANVDGLAKVSDRLGIATESMAGLQHAADLAGVSNQTLNTGLRTMLKNVGEAAQGFGEGARAFDVLGLSAQKLSALSPDMQLQKILDTLAGVENVTLRNATAAQIFGGRATEMLNLIADGAGGIRKATEDARAWGLALNRVDAAKIEIANDAVNRAGSAIRGLANTVSVYLTPFIAEVANSFADAAAEADGFKTETTAIFDQIILGTARMTDNLRPGLNFMKKSVGEIWDGFRSLPTWAQEVGIIGALLAGKKGVALMAVVSGAVEDTKTTAQWFAAYQAGHVSFPEWLLTGNAAAKEKLKELGTFVEDIKLEGPSLLGSLFGKGPGDPDPHEFEKAAEAMLARIREKMEAAAKKIAFDRSKLFGAGVEIVAPRKRDDKDRDDFFKYEEGLNKKLAALDLYLMSDTEKLESAFAQRGETLQELYSLDLLSQQEFFGRSAELALQHQAAMGDIEAQGILARREFERQNMTQRIQEVSGMMLQLTNSVATHSKALFQINKVAGIANAIVNAHEGASKTLAKYPWPLAQILAGLHYAAGFAQVQAIRSASFGGSTSAPSIGGGGAIPVTDVGAPSPVAAPGRTTVIHVEFVGDYFDRALIVDKLMPLINEYTMDGGRLELVPR